jgi:glutathione S-transferase
VAAHRQHARVFLLALEARLLQATADGPSGARAKAAGEPAESGEPGQPSVCPALFGTRPALADFAIAPFVRQFAQADAAHWQSGDWPAVRAWLAAMLARPEFEAQVMRKHALWVAPPA